MCKCHVASGSVKKRERLSRVFTKADPDRDGGFTDFVQRVTARRAASFKASALCTQRGSVGPLASPWGHLQTTCNHLQTI